MFHAPTTEIWTFELKSHSQQPKFWPVEISWDCQKWGSLVQGISQGTLQPCLRAHLLLGMNCWVWLESIQLSSRVRSVFGILAQINWYAQSPGTLWHAFWLADSIISVAQQGTTLHLTLLHMDHNTLHSRGVLDTSMGQYKWVIPILQLSPYTDSTLCYSRGLLAHVFSCQCATTSNIEQHMHLLIGPTCWHMMVLNSFQVVKPPSHLMASHNWNWQGKNQYGDIHEYYITVWFSDYWNSWVCKVKALSNGDAKSLH